ncbi:MAG TPA: hypothetical protein VN903_37105 [Polyangia bacterium]|nr:hypothetical protein [Polyangia bacterium]
MTDDQSPAQPPVCENERPDLPGAAAGHQLEPIAIPQPPSFARANAAKAAKGRVPEKIVCRGAECLKINAGGVLKNRIKFGADARTATKRREHCLVCERAKNRATRARTGGDGYKAKATVQLPPSEKPDLPIVRAVSAAEKVLGELMTAGEGLLNGANGMITPEAFNAVLEQRRQLYGLAGMDSLFDLANMPQSDNSMLMQVKMLAAKALIEYAKADGPGKPSGLDGMLSDMHADFLAHAPRIRSVRQTTTEMIVDGGEKTVN